NPRDWRGRAGTSREAEPPFRIREGINRDQQGRPRKPRPRLLTARFTVRVRAPEPICFPSSADAPQKAFGWYATDLRLIRYIYFGTYATLPGHEGARSRRLSARNGSSPSLPGRPSNRLRAGSQGCAASTLRLMGVDWPGCPAFKAIRFEPRTFG